MPASEKVMQLLHDINHLAVGTPALSPSGFPCIRISNTPDTLLGREAESAQLWQALSRHRAVPPGEGNLPSACLSAPPLTPCALALLSAAELVNQNIAKIDTAVFSRDKPATSLLQGIDQAVNQMITSLLPWRAAAAQQQAATLPPEAPDILLNRLDDGLSAQQRQQLALSLSGSEIVIISGSGRQERAPESSMRQLIRMHELAIRENSRDSSSVGAKIVAFGEQQNALSLALFRKGVSLKDANYFIASGLIALLGHFVILLGSVYSGEILAREPGESKDDWLRRLALNFIMTPDATAIKAFNPPFRPVKSLPGTLITHEASGLTQHSILQQQIAGQRWHIFPGADNHGTAVKAGAPLLLNHSASYNLQSKKWKINGIEGEHSFSYQAPAEYFIKTAEGYYPLPAHGSDGSFQLSTQKKIYFNTLKQQWQEMHPANTHLHSRVLSLLPEALISRHPGEQRVLSSLSGLERKVWYAIEGGRHYLEINARAVDNPHKVTTGYVEGVMEGQFFSFRDLNYPAENQPVYRQVALRWQPNNQRWDVAPSPYRLLKMAESAIDLNKLPGQQQLIETPVAVYHKPGLYKAGLGYFLRWSAASDGSARYLELLPSAYENEFQPVLTTDGQQAALLAGAQFRYQPDTMEWQFRRLTHAVFLGLPDTVKVQPDPPLHITERLPGHQDAYRREQHIYLCTGSDEQGEAEYIRVEQDAEDEDLFTLKVAQTRLADNTLLYRYGEDDEFVAEAPELCRIRRGDDDRCGESAGWPAEKRSRPEEKSDAEARQWLKEQGRLWREAIESPTNESVVLKNMAYALRLYRLADGTVPNRMIAWYSGVTLKGFKARLARITQLQKNNPEEYHWLSASQQDAHESYMGYALRLYRLAGPEVTVQMIATWSGVNRASLKVSVDAISTEAIPWFNSHPRQAAEGDMDYAVRLSQEAHPGVSTSDIARHARVDRFALYSRLRQGGPDKPLPAWALEWLRDVTQREGERDMDYALRLVDLRDVKGSLGDTKARLISDRQIAQYAKINADTLATEISRLLQSREWLASLPRLAEELPVDDEEATRRYILRLVRLRFEENKIKRIRLYELAAYAGVLPLHITLWLKAEREKWFIQYQRLAEEAVLPQEDGEAGWLKNQRYSARLVRERNRQRLQWLINDQEIAKHASVELKVVRQAQQAESDDIKPVLSEALDGEADWRPATGLLHLQLRHNAPLLTAPDHPHQSITRQVIQPPVTLSNLDKLLSGLKGAQRKELEKRFLARATELVNGDGDRQDYYFDTLGNRHDGVLSEYLQVIWDEQNPQVGLQVIAKKTIPVHTVIGAYCGVWHASDATLTAEFRKIGSQRALTYLWGDFDGEGSVSGYQNANILALINTAEMAGHSSLGSNNLDVSYINGKIPLYSSNREIKPGEQLLVSYGDSYSPEYFIQRMLNNEIINIIARSERRFISVADSAGVPLVSYGPQGEVAAQDISQQQNKFFLQERVDTRGILRYDVIKMNGKRRKKLAIGRDDANNIYYALAKVIYPRSARVLINEKMETMMLEVIAHQAKIKAEPV